MTTLTRHAINAALVIGAASCLIPAIENNLAGLIVRGGHWYEAALFIVPVVTASFAAITLERAVKSRHYYIGIVAAVMLLATITFNLTNALGASLLSRATFAEPRANATEAIQRLENERADILGSLGTASANVDFATVGELEAELAKAEVSLIFSRSKQCTDITLGDSSAHCAARAVILGQLAAAKDRAAKFKRLDDIRIELAKLPRPQVVDPKIDGLLALLGAFDWAKDSDRASVGLAYDILLAAFVELLAAFGPGMFLYARLAAPKAQSAPTVVAQEITVARPKPVEATMPADVRAFLEQHVNVRPGTKVSAEELCAAFNFAHADRVHQIKPAVLGRYVNALYRPAKDASSKTAVYLGIELLPANATKIDAMKRKS
jgi:hypothetical protein